MGKGEKSKLICDEDKMERMAEYIETYMQYFDTVLIKDGCLVDEYKHQKEVIEELIEKLRNGNRSVFSNKKIEAALESMDMDRLRD